jgi:hypothetical protein
VSIQSLYIEIWRLNSLAFPNQSGPLLDIIGRDALLEMTQIQRSEFLKKNRTRLMKHVLALVSSLESYSSADQTTTRDDDEGGRRRERVVETETGMSRAEGRRVKQLEDTVAELRAEISRLKEETDKLRRGWQALNNRQLPITLPVPSVVPPMGTYDHDLGYQLTIRVRQGGAG